MGSESPITNEQLLVMIKGHTTAASDATKQPMDTREQLVKVKDEALNEFSTYQAGNGGAEAIELLEMERRLDQQATTPEIRGRRVPVHSEVRCERT